MVRNAMETSKDYFRSAVPPGRSGEWVVERVHLPEREYDPQADRRPNCFKFRPGVYTGLRRGGTLFMSDLYDEWWTQLPAVREAQDRGGRVVLTGLGLGLVAEAILRAPGHRVEGITIVEKSPDVIRLVARHLEDRYPGQIEVVEADAFEWAPAAERRFTVGWHDVWPDPYSAEVMADVAHLRERYSRWCDWQGSWPETYLAELQGDGAAVISDR